MKEVAVKLDAIVKRLSGKKSIDAKTLVEFKTFFKCLAFVACSAKAIVKQKMFGETLARIAKAGEVLNIERWCWWTPTQLSLLEQAEKLSRVILIGGNGTGKTAILDAFATKMAKLQNGGVIFAIQKVNFAAMPNGRPLLQLELEVKFKNLKNISVHTFEKLDSHDVVNWTNKTICIDEIHMKVSFSSCQRNLIKTFQIEAIIALVTKMAMIFS